MRLHTPGPWRVKPWVEKDADGAIENTGLQVVSVVGGTETGIFSSCDEGREDREEADIHLIAAAPYMLSALQEIASGTYDTWTEGYRAQQIAIAAIAKATNDNT